MSRGLGIMQHMILESLDESRKWMAEPMTMQYCSYTIRLGRYWNHKPEDNDPYVVRVNGELVFLDEDTFDLSATLRYLAEKQGKMQKYIHGMEVSPVFVCSFWRAAKRLTQTGYLIRWHEKTNRIVCKGLRLTLNKS